MSHYAPYRPDAAGVPLEGVVFRSARPADAGRIAEISAERSGGDATKITPRIVDELERIAAGRLQRLTCVAVVRHAKDDPAGSVVAYGRCAFLDWQERDGEAPPVGWYLTGVVVETTYRRRGIGRKITAHRLDWLAERTHEAYYWVDEANQASIALHEALGFEELARGLRISAVHNEAPQALFRKRLR